MQWYFITKNCLSLRQLWAGFETLWREKLCPPYMRRNQPSHPSPFNMNIKGKKWPRHLILPLNQAQYPSGTQISQNWLYIMVKLLILIGFPILGSMYSLYHKSCWKKNYLMNYYSTTKNEMTVLISGKIPCRYMAALIQGYHGKGWVRVLPPQGLTCPQKNCPVPFKELAFSKPFGLFVIIVIMITHHSSQITSHFSSMHIIFQNFLWESSSRSPKQYIFNLYPSRLFG